MNPFERYLSVWVALCMVLGVVIGRAFPGLIQGVRSLEITRGSQINLPIAVLIWLMIYPMMLKIDFRSIAEVRRRLTSAGYRADLVEARGEGDDPVAGDRAVGRAQAGEAAAHARPDDAATRLAAHREAH